MLNNDEIEVLEDILFAEPWERSHWTSSGCMGWSAPV